MVTNTATNVAERVTSNAIGDYVVIPLNPGTYSVTVTAPGFQTAVRGNVELQAGQDLRIDINLQIGEMAEVVRMTAEVPIINTNRAWWVT